MPAPSDSFTPGRRLELIALFGVLTVFIPIGIDMYLPALPTIARDFHSSIAAIEHSMAVFFLGIAIGQAVIGPISDRFGRRVPLMTGMGFYVLGCIGSAAAQGPLTLDAARFVQAMGGCAGTVLARACVRDLFPPAQAGRIFAQMLLILSVSPLFAPFAGGWLMLLAGWRSIFWFQGITAALCVVLIWFQLPESHPGSDRRLHPLHVLKDYWEIGRDRNFLGYILPATLAGGGLYVFLTGWPHVVMDIYHVAPEYFGFTFVMNGVGLIIVSQGTARWLRHRPGQPLLLAGIAANAVTGALALLFGITGWGGLLGLIPWMFLYSAMIGCTNPTAAGLTMLHFGHAAGMTSALIGIFLYSGATVAALAMGSFTAATPLPQTALMCVFGVSALVTYLLFRPREAR